MDRTCSARNREEKRKVDKMVVCPYCGKENADGSAFCCECGAPLKAASEAAASAQIYDQQDTASFEPAGGVFGAKPASGGFDAGSPQDFGGQAETLTQPTYNSTFEQTQSSTYDEQTYQSTQQTYQPAPAQNQTYSQQGAGQSNYQQGPAQPTYQQTNWNAPIAPIPTGGLLAWSIITILLCTIPGIVALVNTLGINKATTVEEQQKKMSAARLWCIIGTVLGILGVIGNLAANMH